MPIREMLLSCIISLFGSTASSYSSSLLLAMPCPKPGKKAQMLNLVVANTVLNPLAVIFKLPPLPVGTFPVCEVNNNKEEPHHEPCQKPFMPLDALKEDEDFDELNVDAIVLDPEEEAEVAEANVVADTDGVTVFLRPLSPCDLVCVESQLAACATPFCPSLLHHKCHGAKWAPDIQWLTKLIQCLALLTRLGYKTPL
jgi:hypothetical protein